MAGQKQASDTALVALHELLATVLAAQVGQTESYVTEEGEVVVENVAPPAVLAVAAKFLKDNSITCAIEADENLGKLEDIFAGKQKKGRATLAAVPMIEQTG